MVAGFTRGLEACHCGHLHIGGAIALPIPAQCGIWLRVMSFYHLKMTLLEATSYFIVATLAYSRDCYECLGANWFATNHVRKGLAFLTRECSQ